jgi:DNA-binding transcriptional LysR family regulator
MNLRQLQQMVTLVETRNFHRAAELLHMAQPPLSVSIRRLEEELGGKLFERSTGGLVPTPLAQAILGDARSALFHTEQCKLKAQEALQGLEGLLRMGFIGTATYQLLPALIPRLRQQFPKLELDLREMTSLEILEGLHTQQLDMGFLRFPVLDTLKADVIALERDDFVLAVPAHSPLAKTPGLRIPLSQVAKESFILYPQQRVPSLAVLAYMRCQLSRFTPHVVQEAMQVHTILSLVACGVGVALVAGVARHHPMPGVVCLELTDTPPEFCVGMAVAVASHRRNALVSKVLHHVLQHHQSQEMRTAPPEHYRQR